MRVILKKDVPSLGRAGDIKEVRDGYARNYLIPRDLVMSADARSLGMQAFLKKVQDAKVKKRKQSAEESAKSLQGVVVSIPMKIGEEGRLFGSVTNMMIAKSLEKQKFTIDRKYILLEEPLKALGEYKVTVRFYEGIESAITVRVTDESGSIEIPVAETSAS